MIMLDAGCRHASNAYPPLNHLSSLYQMTRASLIHICLDQQLLNLVLFISAVLHTRAKQESNQKKEERTHLDSQDLSVQFPSFIGSNTSSNDGSANSTSPTQSGLGRKENVWYVLVFTEEREVEYDLDRFDVGC